MAGYYSEYLFHFTGRGDSEKGYNCLIGILEKGFKLNWNRELTEFEKSFHNEYRFDVATPVVCFTDIPLDNISTHAERYGQFGIGISKDWAKKSGAQPVIYVDRENMGFGQAFRLLIGHLEDNRDVESSMRYIIPLLKDIEYYREREWRIVMLEKKEEDYRLEFDREAVRLLVVPHKYITRLYNDIRAIFNKRYGNDEITFAIIPFEDIERLTGVLEWRKS